MERGIDPGKERGLLILEAGERVRIMWPPSWGKRCRRYGPLTPFTTTQRRKSKSSLKRQPGDYGGHGSGKKADEGTKRRLPRRQRTRAAWEPREIKAMAEEKKHRKTKEEETREASVSDTDTTEEEKENARKLHAVKMIEKILYLVK